MAKQIGFLKIKGTYDDITFAQTKDGFQVRQKSSISAERIAKDPAYKRTRENNSEFSRAGKAGKLFRHAFGAQLKGAADHRITARLTAQMIKVLQADLTSVRGQRNIVDGEAELLQGFECNSGAPLVTTFTAPFTAAFDRVAGSFTVTIPSFSPAISLPLPEGATHFQFVSAAAAINFEEEVSVTDAALSAVLPLNGAATAPITLLSGVGANSTHPLFGLLGIQFLQQVNGIDYPLNNKSFNALKVITVLGL